MPNISKIKINNILYDIKDANGFSGSWNDLADKPFYEDESGNIIYLDDKFISENIARADSVVEQISNHDTDINAHKSIQNAVAANEAAISLLLNGSDPETIDSVNDLINYVTEHGSEVTGIKADIKANSDAINAVSTLVGDTAVSEQISTAISESVADWNQNDEAAANYVKNRTHYTEVVEESIAGNVYDIPITNLYTGQTQVHNLHIPLQLGQTWTITLAEKYLGGTETCEVQQADDGAFCLYYYKSSSTALLTFTTDSIAAATWSDVQYLTGVTLTCVSGSVFTETVHKIDPKYLPDDEIFHVTKDVTTFTEVMAAHRAGKYCVLDLTSGAMPLVRFGSTLAFAKAEVTSPTNCKVSFYTLDRADNWTTGSFPITSVTEIGDNPSVERLVTEYAVANALSLKADKTDIVQSDWNQADETAPNYIKNKPEIVTDDEIIELLIQEDMFPVVQDSDGSLLADESDNILLW